MLRVLAFSRKQRKYGTLWSWISCNISNHSARFEGMIYLNQRPIWLTKYDRYPSHDIGTCLMTRKYFGDETRRITITHNTPRTHFRWRQLNTFCCAKTVLRSTIFQCSPPGHVWGSGPITNWIRAPNICLKKHATYRYTCVLVRTTQ